MLIKTSVLLLAVLGAVHSDSGYSAPSAAAPSGGYGAPSGGYSAPSGGGASYAAPDYADYGEQVAYETAPDNGGFDLGKFEELLPLFLAVLLAIILAQLLSPLLSQLFMVLIGILPIALEIKAPIVNMVLAPFNLGLCDITDPAAITLFPATARSFSEAMFSESTGRMFADGISTIITNLQSKYFLYFCVLLFFDFFN